MSLLGNIVDIVWLDLEFVDEYLRKINFKRVGRLFCAWMLEGSKSVRTFISKISTTTRNRVGQLQVHKKSTYFSAISGNDSWKYVQQEEAVS